MKTLLTVYPVIAALIRSTLCSRAAMSYRLCFCLLILSTLLFKPATSEAQIIWVPDDHPTIQAAIDAAAKFWQHLCEAWDIF
jgi:hypothetical protein